MLLRLTHKLQSAFNRHGLWLNLCFLLLLSYGALSWILSSQWWRESYRTSTPGHANYRAKLHGFDFRPSNRPDQVGDWRLIGTMMTDGGEPTAMVNHQGSRMVVHAGQPLEGGLQVASIENGLLTLQSGKTVVTLALPVQPVAAGNRMQAGIQIDLDRRGALEAFPALQWTPVPLGGAFVAMRLHVSSQLRVADTFGWRDGDLIESVNGMPVTLDDVREKLLERIRNDESIGIRVRRDGRVLRFRYSLYD
jgi:hypothetical protein